MTLQITAVVLGVGDLDRSKRFYGDGLGCAIAQDYPNWVSFDLGNGSSLGLYAREALAADAGTTADGTGFSGVTLHFIVSGNDAVDDVLGRAERAGAQVTRPAQDSQWGGYFGWFSDPDGHLWKVAAPSADA